MAAELVAVVASADVASVLLVLAVIVEGELAAVATVLLVVVVALLPAVDVGQSDIVPLVVPFVAVVAAAAPAALVLAFELVGFFLSSYQYCVLTAAIAASE